MKTPAANSRKILLVDDEPNILAALKRALRREDFDLTLTVSPEAAIRELANQRYAVILSDQQMPAIGGAELLERAREVSPHTVRIMLTGYADTQAAVEAVNRGAVYRFLTKPWNDEELRASLKQAVTEFKKNHDLSRQLITDRLTGTYNRHYLDQRLDEELSRCLRYKRPLSIILTDIDKFKTINDTHGHLVGDEVLAMFGKVLSEQSRVNDAVCRYGGDEFVLILPETTLVGACQKAKALRESARGLKIEHKDGQRISFTISIGVATLEPDIDCVEDLLSRADNALLASKRFGRDKIGVYQDGEIEDLSLSLP